MWHRELVKHLPGLPHPMSRELDKAMEMKNAKRMGRATEVVESRSTERAICELCGDVISTVNGGRHTGSLFLPFERLLDLHMEQRHANVCVLPVRGGLRQAA
jgi:hypothetical protein